MIIATLEKCRFSMNYPFTIEKTNQATTKTQLVNEPTTTDSPRVRKAMLI